MKIPFRTLDMHLKGHVVGCGVQGSKCLAVDVSQGSGRKWRINWSLEGDLGDRAFASALSKKTGKRHFWVSPTEEGGLQVETARMIEIPEVALARRSSPDEFFRTQIQSRFVSETIVIGGTRIRAAVTQDGKTTRETHDVGGGAIRDNIRNDYRNWYSRMGIRRPHIASTALALANTYLALYPESKRLASPVRMVALKGRSVYRVVLMDDWKYIDEILLPRMDGDDATKDVVYGRVNGWIEYFVNIHPELKDKIKPLIVTVKEAHTSDYEHWDFWGEWAMGKIEMTEAVAAPILANRDIAPIAFGMALQGGC